MRIVIVHNAVSAEASPDERDVLVQIDAVSAALARQGHDVSCLECTLDLARVKRRLQEIRPDAAFNLVESIDGTDRLMFLATALLDSMQIPYTGSPTAAIVLSGNKLLAKRQLSQAGLPTPDWSSGPAQPACRDANGIECRPTPGKYILKPVCEHASFGLDDDAIVEVADPLDLAGLVRARSAKLGRPCFAERFIEGREFNLSLLAAAVGGWTPASPAGGPQVLPPAEIDFSAFPLDKPRIVGYQAKWEPDSFEYRETPRRFVSSKADVHLVVQLQELATRCWHLFGLRGYARVDFRVDELGQPWILEVNANPCLSPDAGFAAALEQAGIAYELAIARILKDFRIEELKDLEFGEYDDLTIRKPQTTIHNLSTPSGNARTPDVTLRHEVTAADGDAVRQIVDSTGVFRPDEVDVAVELVTERLAKGSASGYFFVFADRDGKTVGYACYGPIACTVASYDLYWIAVDKRLHSRGIGRLLLAESEKLIRQAGGRRIYVETSSRPQYDATRAFYERCNYHKEAVLTDFYDAGDDKVVYVKAV